MVKCVEFKGRCEIDIRIRKDIRPAGPPAFSFDLDPCPLICAVLSLRPPLHMFAHICGDGDTGDSREVRGSEVNVCSRGIQQNI